MATYNEIDRQHQQNGDGITGWRKFQTASGGNITAANLPTIGVSEMVDENDAAIPNCIARSRLVTYPAGIKSAPLLTYNYATPNPNDINTTDDDLPAKQWQVGAEAVQIDDPSGSWIWNGTSDSVFTPVFKRVGMTSFSETRTDLSEEDKDSFLELVDGLVGKINNAAFRSRGKGTVLFEGVTGQNYYNENGDERYKFELHFLHRAINDDLTAITTDTWQYILDPDTGVWKIPVTSAGGKKLYSEGNLATLFD